MGHLNTKKKKQKPCNQPQEPRRKQGCQSPTLPSHRVCMLCMYVCLLLFYAILAGQPYRQSSKGMQYEKDKKRRESRRHPALSSLHGSLAARLKFPLVVHVPGYPEALLAAATYT